MLKGYGMIGTRLDSRLPITLPILGRIILAASALDDSFYYTCRFQAYLLFTHSQGWGKSATQSQATSFKPSLKLITG